jgi:hypothetical protein
MISLHEKILVLAKWAHDITQRLRRQVSNDRGLVKILLKGAAQLPQCRSMRGAQVVPDDLRVKLPVRNSRLEV